ncbi:MAG: GTP cyclohydrolase I FolE, partial [Candidatus Subteraquimicrobiales bacterium]|nr:GTP cyclohydrolase I FolE [Candidatus Subteraquimicrobiales bacterium]
RLADMYEEVFAGLYQDPVEFIREIPGEKHDEMVLIKDVPFYSICEHHLVPFFGKAHVAYIPNKSGKIVGENDLIKVVDVIAKRPQLQERLTTMIADVLVKAIKPRGVLVVIKAEHLCMSMRGVKKPGSLTITSAVRGIFRENSATRAEAMSLIG